MKWHKQGLIYVPNGKQSWSKTHAMVPTPELLEDRIRIYLTSCDELGVGRAGYIEVSAEDPKNILHITETPILDIGLPGSFDDNGIIPTSVLTLPDGRKYLYYVGFEIGTKIPYRMLTGIAQSKNQGKTFERVLRTPILERSQKELYFRCGPFVMLDDGLFKLWYVAGSEWFNLNGKDVPVYTIHYLESNDGLTWGNEGLECLKMESQDEHGFGRPYVIKEKGLYKMFYSIRFKQKGYRLGYAESRNGVDWQRKDNEMGLDASQSGWDSETVCYSAVISYRDRTYLFYNGNDFGRSGFGYACLEK
jgi:hypothetical protein